MTASTGAEAAAAVLETHGIDVVFCLPGEETIALLEAIDGRGIQVVVCRHEQHAAFMAATHGRLTGSPGVLVTTLGPGATNALTGLAHATLGGFPMVHIAGQKPLRDNWEGSFQVVDLAAAADPVTKTAIRCTDPAEVGPTVADGLREARRGRPGAVFVELPTDVARGAAGEVELAPGPAPGSGRSVADATSIADVHGALAAARRPVAVIAGGAQDRAVSAALSRFATEAGVPVIPLQTGIGAIAADHPLAMPAIGMHRPDAAHLTLESADLVITVGYHPDEHPPLAWNRCGGAIVHVAEWPAPIRSGYQVRHELVGAPAVALLDLADRATAAPAAWAEEVRNAIEEQLASEDLTAIGEGIAPIDVVRAIRASVARNDIVALDNGSYKLWFARHYRADEPNSLLLDNGLATMGAGLAIATEAARLHPDRHVVAVVGDGGFLMNVGDLETATRLGVENMTVVVLRDDTYGLIADHQRDRNARRVGVDLSNPDFVELARSFGLRGVRATSATELASALRTGLTAPGLHLIDCTLDELADQRLHRADSLTGARQRLSTDARGLTTDLIG